MTKKEEAFKCFEEGMVSVSDVAKKIDASVNSVRTYKTMWNNDKYGDMTPGDFADKLFPEGTDGAVEHIAAVGKKVENTEQKNILNIPKKTRKFEVKRTVEITAEFGIYSIAGNVADVHLETQKMGLTKTDLLAFAEELQAVAEEM